MISKILVIADPLRESLELVLDALQTIQKHQPNIKVIFVSFLSEPSLKNLGPNILNLLLKEEKQTIERTETYFTHEDIPHQIKLIAAPHWEAILNEIRKGDEDFIILQGEFLRILKRDDLDRELYSRANFKPRCPILVINEPENTVFSRSFHSEIS